MNTDILIAGSGCSGLYCALHLPADKNVTVITKSELINSNSYLAQGGICFVLDEKDSFTPEEYAFWQDVRNTHAAINGKQVKDYTEAQMLKWYNGLHTDSAEYKMWGNGIALPCAEDVMGRIAKELRRKHDE